MSGVGGSDIDSVYTCIMYMFVLSFYLFRVPAFSCRLQLNSGSPSGLWQPRWQSGAMLGAILFLVMAGEAPPVHTEESKLNSLAALELLVNWATLGMDISSVAAAAAEDGGSTMLHEAVAHGHTEAVEALLAAGASVDAKMSGTTAEGVLVTLRPLHVAAGKGDMGPLIALIAAGAYLDTTSHHGLTPLH